MLALLALTACRGGFRTSDTVLTEAEVGPQGGELRIDEGRYAGVALSIPAGALDRAVRIRLVQPAGFATSYAPPVSDPFRIEPVDLDLFTPASLTAPYKPENVSTTAPGNIRGYVQRATGTRELVPTEVDAVAGSARFDIEGFGLFGISAASDALPAWGYLPRSQAATAFEGGVTVAITDAGGDPRWGGGDLSLWSVRDADGEIGLAVDPLGGSVLGRFDAAEPWHEVWDQPLPPIAFEATTAAGATKWFDPPGSPARQGWVTAERTVRHSTPRTVGGTLILDLLEVDLRIEWQTPENSGTTALRVWLAPGTGVIAVQIDDGPVLKRAQ